MGTFFMSVDQAAFDAAFAGLPPDEAAALITGTQSLSGDQLAALGDAEGNGGYGLRFDPAPVGHLKFIPCATEGTGNRGWHMLAPATDECRRLVNAFRREEFARRLGATREIADRVFSAAHGYEPALAAAVAVWPILSRCPGISDKSLRELGFRPGHPHEGAGIAAVRAALS